MPGRLTTDTFIQRANKVHDDKYDYSHVRYENVHKKELIVCPIHGKFYQSYKLHVMRGQACPKCGRKKQGQSKRLSKEKFIERVKKIHNNKYDYSKVKLETQHDEITIICPFHGEFKQQAHSHLYDKRGCETCFRLSCRLTTEEFIQKAQNLFGNFYGYKNTNYVTSGVQVEILCPHHGIQWITPTDHFRIGCFECKRNKLEDKWLDEVRLPKNREYRQVRLVVENNLFVVDGFDPNTNTVYLFHGDYWHGNPDVFDHTKRNKVNGKPFKQLYEETLDYEKRLKDNGYNVISIWENDWKRRR